MLRKLAGLAAAGAAALLPQAANAATILGETITISESIGGTYLGYGFYSGASTQQLTRTIAAGAEVAGSGTGDWLGLPLLPTTFDIDPLAGLMSFNFYDWPYGILVQLYPWTVTVELSPNAAERFSGMWLIYRDSAFQAPSASFTGNKVTFVLDGGFANFVSQHRPHVFSAIFGFTTEPNVGGGVPEPASWAMMLAGFAAAGAAMRRRPRVRVSFA